MSNQVAAPELKGFDLKAIQDGLARLQEVDAKMEVFKEKVLTVSIADMEDKKGYEAVKSLRGEMRKERTPLEDERKTAVKPLNELVKQVNTKYKEYIDGYAELEDGLKTQEAWYTSYHENKKIEEEQAKEKAIEAKINMLIECGLVYDKDNGYYKNDIGIAVNRQSIITMSEEDFTALALKAKERKLEIDREREAEAKKQAMIEQRKAILLKAGMLQGADKFVVAHEKESKMVEATNEEISTMSTFDFDTLADWVVFVVKDNAEYRAEQKAIADKFAAEQKKFAEEKAEFERKQAEEKANALREKAKIFRDRLEVEGFVYSFGESLEKSTLSFLNRMGNKTVTIGQLLESETLLAETIEAATILKNKLQEANNADRIEAEKKAKDKEIADALEEKNRKIAEAKKKTASKKDLAICTPFIQTLAEVSDDIMKAKYEVIDPYIIKLCDEVNAAINNFKNSTKHLG